MSDRAETRWSDAAVAGGIGVHPDVLRALEAILAELRGLRADLRRGTSIRGLRAALAEEFGDGGFTVAGLLEIADHEPGELAAVLGELVDLSALPRSRATALGRLLATVPGITVEGERRGAALYRLADLGRGGPQWPR